MAGSLAAGCSTYRVDDVYKPLQGQEQPLEFRQDDIRLRVSVDSDRRFFSMGVLGVPAIPTYASTSDPGEVVLRIAVTMARPRDFSFAARPCLHAGGEPAFCPHTVQVSAYALSQDEGGRWRPIPGFYGKRALDVPPDASRRIDHRRIYEYYAYSGAPALGSLNVHVWYRFKCEKPCPQRLAVDMPDLVQVEAMPLPSAVVQLERKRETEYRAVSP